jgi:hypothetical protein
LRDRLPIITILLRGDYFITIDLQSALHCAYDAGEFSDFVFACQPQPPLNEWDDEWAKAVIRNGSATA